MFTDTVDQLAAGQRYHDLLREAERARKSARAGSRCACGPEGGSSGCCCTDC